MDGESVERDSCPNISGSQQGARGEFCTYLKKKVEKKKYVASLE